LLDTSSPEVRRQLPAVDLRPRSAPLNNFHALASRAAGIAALKAPPARNEMNPRAIAFCEPTWRLTLSQVTQAEYITISPATMAGTDVAMTRSATPLGKETAQRCAEHKAHDVAKRRPHISARVVSEPRNAAVARFQRSAVPATSAPSVRQVIGTGGRTSARPQVAGERHFGTAATA
jgi:hypothetical protein